MLPLFGPADVRDGIGKVGDSSSWVAPYIERDSIRWSIYGLYVIDLRARLLDQEKALDQVYDRYAFLRNVYLQRRQYLVTDGQVAQEPIEEEPLDEPAATPQ